MEGAYAERVARLGAVANDRVVHLLAPRLNGLEHQLALAGKLEDLIVELRNRILVLDCLFLEEAHLVHISLHVVDGFPGRENGLARVGARTVRDDFGDDDPTVEGLGRKRDWALDIEGRRRASGLNDFGHVGRYIGVVVVHVESEPRRGLFAISRLVARTLLALGRVESRG